MLADRVRMILGGMKGMKTYNIELLNSSIGAVEYIDFLQETGIVRVPLPHLTQRKVSRYMVFCTLDVKRLMVENNRIYINGTAYVEIFQTTTPGLFTHIDGDAWGLTGLSSNNVFVIDLEKVAQYSGIAIENITSIEFQIMRA